MLWLDFTHVNFSYCVHELSQAYEFSSYVKHMHTTLAIEFSSSFAISSSRNESFSTILFLQDHPYQLLLAK